MKTEIIRQFNITISCDEAQAKMICNALHKVYKPMKEKHGYGDPEATVLRIARNVFADAIGASYMGEDS